MTGLVNLFWRPIEVSNQATEASSHAVVCSADGIRGMIENRGGMAYVTGMVLVPSQFMENAKKSRKILNQVDQNSIEPFTFRVDGDTVHGIIYYPDGWKRENKSACILYHNPNGMTVASYFNRNRLTWTPGEFMKAAKCPIILYDYRGTGLNSEVFQLSSTKLSPTYVTVVNDGLRALQCALGLFQSVKVVGSSLGGGVATISLENHLKSWPSDAARVSLVNHDSFTKTPRVVLPSLGWVADQIGWLAGGLLDAETPMKDLVARGISITVLSHQRDPVIPVGARMAESAVVKAPKVRVIESPLRGHADLSDDMIRELGNF